VKVRDSGMPAEEMWSGFFDPAQVLSIFGLDRGVQDLVEFGCGYGTFTLAAAGIVAGTVHALDIEPEMASVVRQKCRAAGITNVRVTVRDFVADGTGISVASHFHQNIIAIKLHRKCSKNEFRVFRTAAVRQAETPAMTGTGDVAILDDRGAHRAPLMRAVVLNGINSTLDVDQQNFSA
jgi:SAM-dependent methyltransferase